MTSSSLFSKHDMSEEKIEEYQTQSFEVPVNVASVACAENVTGGSQDIQQFETQSLKVDSNLSMIGSVEKETVGAQKLEEVIDVISPDRNYIEIYSPETERSRSANRRRKRDKYDEPLENFLARRKKAKQKKQTFAKKVQSFITNFFSTNKVKREKKGKDDGELDILSFQQYNYTPRRKVRAMDEPDIEIIDVVAALVCKPNQPRVVQKCREMASTSTAVGTSAAAACLVSPETDVTAHTMKSEEVMVHAEGKMKPNSQWELPSERIVEERDQLQKQIQQLSQEMAEMKEVISHKRNLPGLMYMKSKILRKSKKSLKIEPKKKSGKSTRRTTSKDGGSPSEDGGKRMDIDVDMSSLQTGENEAGQNSGTESGAKNMDVDVDMSSLQTGENEAGQNRGTESGVKNMDIDVEMSSLETGENEAGQNRGTESGSKKMDEAAEMSVVEIVENEPRKEVASGSEDGMKKMDIDFARSPLKNTEIEHNKDDGTSIKKNEIHRSSNLVFGGEFHVAPENMDSKDTTSYEDGVLKAMEKSSDPIVLVVDDQHVTSTDHVTEENEEGGKTELSLAQNAAADGIDKKKYLGPDCNNGDEYSDNEALVAAIVSKEDSKKVSDAKDVCRNAKDVTYDEEQIPQKTVSDTEPRPTTIPPPTENEDDLLGNPSEAAALDLDIDENQENKLLGEDNRNQTQAKTSARPSTDDANSNENVEGEESQESEEDDDGGEGGEYSHEGEEGENADDGEESENADEDEEGDENGDDDNELSENEDEDPGPDEVYDDGEENDIEDDDPDCERGNGPNEQDATFMDSTYTGIGSMDINSTVQSIGQIPKPQQSSTPWRRESSMSLDYPSTPKARTGIISKENSVFYSKQQEKRRMSSPTSSDVPV